MARHMLMLALLAVCLSCAALTESVPEEKEDIDSWKSEDFGARGKKGKQWWQQLFGRAAELSATTQEVHTLTYSIYQMLTSPARVNTCPEVTELEYTKLINSKLPVTGVKEDINVVCQPGYKTHDGRTWYKAHCMEEGLWSRTDSCLKQHACNENVTYNAEAGLGFRLFSKELTVGDARAACKADGGVLAYSVTPSVLWQLIGMTDDDGLKSTHLDISKWDGSDVWSNPDGTTAENILWCHGEPSSHTGEFCVETFRNSRCLNNANCNMKRRFLCQYECGIYDTTIAV